MHAILVRRIASMQINCGFLPTPSIQRHTHPPWLSWTCIRFERGIQVPGHYRFGSLLSPKKRSSAAFWLSIEHTIFQSYDEKANNPPHPNHHIAEQCNPSLHFRQLPLLKSTLCVTRARIDPGSTAPERGYNATTA